MPFHLSSRVVPSFELRLRQLGYSRNWSNSSRSTITVVAGHGGGSGPVAEAHDTVVIQVEARVLDTFRHREEPIPGGYPSPIPPPTPPALEPEDGGLWKATMRQGMRLTAVLNPAEDAMSERDPVTGRPAPTTTLIDDVPMRDVVPGTHDMTGRSLPSSALLAMIVRPPRVVAPAPGQAEHTADPFTACLSMARETGAPRELTFDERAELRSAIDELPTGRPGSSWREFHAVQLSGRSDVLSFQVRSAVTAIGDVRYTPVAYRFFLNMLGISGSRTRSTGWSASGGVQPLTFFNLNRPQAGQADRRPTGQAVSNSLVNYGYTWRRSSAVTEGYAA